MGSNNNRRVVASKKISFKVKKTASIYRRGAKIGTLGVSSNVAQLASKFNQMNKGGGEENNGKVCKLLLLCVVVIVIVGFFSLRWPRS